MVGVIIIFVVIIIVIVVVVGVIMVIIVISSSGNTIILLGHTSKELLPIIKSDIFRLWQIDFYLFTMLQINL